MGWQSPLECKSLLPPAENGTESSDKWRMKSVLRAPGFLHAIQCQYARSLLCKDLSGARRHLIPFAPSRTLPPPLLQQDARPLVSHLREHRPTPSLRYPSKSPLHGGFLRSHEDYLLSEALLCTCFYLTIIAREPET